ncbi:hypothetical protein SASPL_149806 [Salvia splendens]|uniref:Glycosyltransferase n=1 Tax=Salvia splendens TaxID=180675 RepID=A0A8X8W6B1_SALSN|nr:UDP-glycosyltransferase 86A1-like [Salvia splendens]KAG6388381.1 hypothetical protein SASPL_149806 [Salvia splendens]
MANSKPHAIVFPYPYQGHITPMINLCLSLASKNLTITFIPLEFNHHSISKAHDLPADAHIFTGARNAGLDIRYAAISDGFPVDFDRDGNDDDRNYSDYWMTMFRDFPGRVDALVAGIVTSSGDSPPSVMITDTFFSWVATPICEKYGMINVSVWTQPAAVFAINYHFDLLRENAHFPPQHGEGEEGIINYIPGVGSMRPRDLMSYVQYPDMIPMLTEIEVKAFDHVKQADFILCNTVEELESDTLSALNQILPSFPIGPINFYDGSLARSLRPHTDCTEWLNSKPPASVLYISFGSINFIADKEELVEFAYGLLVSRVYFIWVIKDDQEKHFLPSGFEDGVGSRGLVVPWCDQDGVLASPATGGFLTHCGWNSVLESMWHGVAMICYPFLVDQPTNRKLVVDDWRIGVNLCDGGRVTREEVAEKIDVVMKGDSALRMKSEVEKVRKKLHNSLGEEGSSHKNLDLFWERLKLSL